MVTGAEYYTMSDETAVDVQRMVCNLSEEIFVRDTEMMKEAMYGKQQKEIFSPDTQNPDEGSEAFPYRDFVVLHSNGCTGSFYHSGDTVITGIW